MSMNPQEVPAVMNELGSMQRTIEDLASALKEHDARLAPVMFEVVEKSTVAAPPPCPSSCALSLALYEQTQKLAILVDSVRMMTSRLAV
jgi:hypothetical protein